jgi:hypothetical protein
MIKLIHLYYFGGGDGGGGGGDGGGGDDNSNNSPSFVDYSWNHDNDNTGKEYGPGTQAVSDAIASGKTPEQATTENSYGWGNWNSDSSGSSGDSTPTPTETKSGDKWNGVDAKEATTKAGNPVDKNGDGKLSFGERVSATLSNAWDTLTGNVTKTNSDGQTTWTSSDKNGDGKISLGERLAGIGGTVWNTAADFVVGEDRKIGGGDSGLVDFITHLPQDIVNLPVTMAMAPINSIAKSLGYDPETGLIGGLNNTVETMYNLSNPLALGVNATYGAIEGAVPGGKYGESQGILGGTLGAIEGALPITYANTAGYAPLSNAINNLPTVTPDVNASIVQYSPPSSDSNSYGTFETALPQSLGPPPAEPEPEAVPEVAPADTNPYAQAPITYSETPTTKSPGDGWEWNGYRWVYTGKVQTQQVPVQTQEAGSSSEDQVLSSSATTNQNTNQADYAPVSQEQIDYANKNPASIAAPKQTRRVISDEDQKNFVPEPGDEDTDIIRQYAENIGAHTYTYKKKSGENPEILHENQPTAQEIAEVIPDAVVETNRGLEVDTARLTMENTAVLAEIARKLKDII